MRDVHAVIAEINNLGFWVNNLFQITHNGKRIWRCNTRNDDLGTSLYAEFANGETLAEALENGLTQCKAELAKRAKKEKPKDDPADLY